MKLHGGYRAIECLVVFTFILSFSTTIMAADPFVDLLFKEIGEMFLEKIYKNSMEEVSEWSAKHLMKSSFISKEVVGGVIDKTLRTQSTRNLTEEFNRELAERFAKRIYKKAIQKPFDTLPDKITREVWEDFLQKTPEKILIEEFLEDKFLHKVVSSTVQEQIEKIPRVFIYSYEAVDEVLPTLFNRGDIRIFHGGQQLTANSPLWHSACKELSERLHKPLQGVTGSPEIPPNQYNKFVKTRFTSYSEFSFDDDAEELIITWIRNGEEFMGKVGAAPLMAALIVPSPKVIRQILCDEANVSPLYADASGLYIAGLPVETVLAAYLRDILCR